MKQATVKLPSGEYLIVGVTNDSTGFNVFDVFRKFVYFYGKAQMHHEDELPPGNWQLLGADPTALTEVEAGEIVEGYGLDKWRNYKVESQYEEWLHKLPTTSLDSLAQSLGISKPYVILKNVEK